MGRICGGLEPEFPRLADGGEGAGVVLSEARRRSRTAVIRARGWGLACGSRWGWEGDKADRVC